MQGKKVILENGESVKPSDVTWETYPAQCSLFLFIPDHSYFKSLLYQINDSDGIISEFMIDNIDSA